MPNNCVVRCIVEGPRASETPWSEPIGFVGIVDGDRLLHSGEIVNTPTRFEFSTYVAWALDEALWLRAAVVCPEGCTLTVVGFDIDDYRSDAHDGERLVFACGPGATLLTTERSLLSSEIASQYFPPELLANRRKQVVVVDTHRSFDFNSVDFFVSDDDDEGNDDDSRTIARDFLAQVAAQILHG